VSSNHHQQQQQEEENAPLANMPGVGLPVKLIKKKPKMSKNGAFKL
jgi:hypothetical protein